MPFPLVLHKRVAAEGRHICGRRVKVAK